MYFIEKNGFWELYINIVTDNLNQLAYFDEVIIKESRLSMIIFAIEIGIFLIISFVLIPMLNKVSKISRKLFIFMLHLNPEDILSIIKTTNKFIKVYIDQDSLENDSLTVLSNDSQSSFSQKTGKASKENKDIKFEYNVEDGEKEEDIDEVFEEALNDKEPKGAEEADKKKVPLSKFKDRKKGILNKNGMKSHTQKFKDSNLFDEKGYSLKDNRLETENLPLVTQKNENALSGNGSVNLFLIYILIFF